MRKADEHMAPWAMHVTDLIGRTPLVELKRVTSDAQATVLAKLEMFSPGGSSKDRVALQMIREAEAQGLLRPGGIITEPTSGNMGVSLAWVASAGGHRCNWCRNWWHLDWRCGRPASA